MEFPTISIEFNRLGYKSKSGLYPIYFRIYFKGKTDYVRIKELPKISESDWIGNAAAGRYVGNFKMNQKVNELLSTSRDWLYSQIMDGHHLTLPTIKSHFQTPKIHQSFNEYAQYYIRSINKNRNEYEKLTYRTIQAYQSFLTKLNDFDPKVSFAEINRDMLEKFDRYLAVKHNLRTTTRRKHIEKLSSVYDGSCQAGLINYDPFLFKYKIRANKKEQSLRVSLTMEEITKWKNFKMSDSRNDFYRKIFLFGCLTGLYYNDIKSLKKENIHCQNVTEKGIKSEKHFIVGQRFKNGEEYVIPLFKDTLKILQECSSDIESEPLFGSLISDQKYNQKLKNLANSIGIPKKISAITARHSFAEMLRTIGMSAEKIAKAMGHRKLSTQENYSKLSVSNAIRGWIEPDL